MSPRIQKKTQKSAHVKDSVNLKSTNTPMKKIIGDSPRRKLKRPQPKDIIVEKWKINVEMDFWHHMTVRFQNSLALEQETDSGKEPPQHEMNDTNEQGQN